MTQNIRQPNMLKAFGRIESFKHDLQRLESTLEAAPLWLPGTSLKKQCDQAVQMINGIAARFDRKLVVTLIGPSGSGKSTLLNALAGLDDFSEVGHQRPTTGNLLVFSDDSEDVRLLADDLGDESIEIRSSSAAVFPEYVILIDSPDTDSAANSRHIPILRNAISHSDMLICVFDGENPKRRDHVDFLAPFVQRFHGESLVGDINKCDRLDEAELQDHILPDFNAYIQSAWHQPVDSVFCISARNHLRDPNWDEAAGPKHRFDEFEDLRKLVFDTINSAGYIVDRRLENARSLHEFIYQEAGRELSKDKTTLEFARQQLADTEKKAHA